MLELVIDSFASGGGASTGIAAAIGRDPDYAINHDAEALAVHAANHPNSVCPPIAEALVRANYAPQVHAVDTAKPFSLAAVA